MLTRTRIGLLCAAAALAVSLPTLRNGFAIDDIYVFVDQPAAHSLRNIPQFFTGDWGMGTTNTQERALNTRYYRPIPTTLGALEYTLFGLRPAGYHLTSALLHMATAALVALLFWQITGGAVIATLLGGLVFAIHPMQSEAFCAACYQTTLLAGFFGTLVLVLFGRVLERGPRPGTLLALGASLLVALVCKEESFAIPFFVLAWTGLLRPAGWRRALWTGAIAMGIPLVLVLMLRHAFLVPSTVTYFADELARVIVLTMVRVAGFHRLGSAGSRAGQSGHTHHRGSRRTLPLPSHARLGLAHGLVARTRTCPRTQGRLDPVAAIALLFVAYAVRTVTSVPDWRSDEPLKVATAEAFLESPAPLLNLATYYER